MQAMKMTTIIEARGLTKNYGDTPALRGIELNVQSGRIVGLIGPNGSGKTTAIKAILGLTGFDGELKVLGKDPRTERNELMNEVCFIADVAVLPRWIKVSQALDFVAGVHPRFDRKRAEDFLARTDIRLDRRVRQLSKGMVTQLHLALILAIDARLLVLDEPTLGLDLLFRRSFYDNLLNDYFDKERTILVTTHQVEEIENILTDVIFLQRGKIMLDSAMDLLGERYLQLVPAAGNVDAARALKPFYEREVFGRVAMLYDGRKPAELEPLGETRVPSVADLFVALMGGSDANSRLAGAAGTKEAA
jgi:ABC-2 type transport system ATP-binding protein